MRKTPRRTGPALMLGLLIIAVPISAVADPCFTWSCSSSNLGECSFDASCSSAKPYIWKYHWTWDDGTTSGWVADPTPTHDYGSTGLPYPDVTLKIYPWGGTIEEVTCQVVVRNVVGPPQPMSGTCN